MSNNEEKQVNDLKSQFKGSIDNELQSKIFDTLATYGDKGIDAINDLMNYTIDDKLKSHGLDLIKKIRESKI